jgi:acyl carrier protein
MIVMDKERALKTLRQWILDEGTRRDPPGPADGADLVQEGWLDSLGIMSLISHVEDLLGRPLGEREIRMHNFASLSAIAHAFFERG